MLDWDRVNVFCHLFNPGAYLRDHLHVVLDLVGDSSFLILSMHFLIPLKRILDLLLVVIALWLVVWRHLSPLVGIFLSYMFGPLPLWLLHHPMIIINKYYSYSRASFAFLTHSCCSFSFSIRYYFSSFRLRPLFLLSMWKSSSKLVAYFLEDIFVKF